MCKRDVKGAFKLIPVFIAGLTHMGCRFGKFLVAYLSTFFGWKPSPANWGEITTLLLQFVAAFGPAIPHQCGPEAFAPSQYVGDGAFVEPWLATRPWLAVTVWGQGPTSFFGLQALRHREKSAEGECSTRIVLWGIEVDTQKGTFTLPRDKVERA